MPIYDSYESGKHYTNNQFALEVQKFAHLPRAEFRKKYQELLEKFTIKEG